MTSYRDTPVGDITAITTGEVVGTWNVFRRLPDGTRRFPGAEIATTWTPEMQAHHDRRNPA